MFKDKIDFWWEEATKFMAAIYSNVDGMSEWKNMWQESKEDFLPYFDEDGRLSLKVSPQTVAFGREDINEAYNKMYEIANNLVYGDKAKFVGLKAQCAHVCQYIKYVTSPFTVDELIGNRILSTTMLVNGVKIPIGTKLSKYIGMHFDNLRDMYSKGLRSDYASLFFTNNNNEDIDKIKDYINVVWSMFINSLKASGTAVISVNPMDFLLVSHHNNNWRSCHNIINGEYKSGGVSYMLDKVSLVGFGYSREENLVYNSFKSTEKIPLKEWRAMVFINDTKDNAIISRQYPGNKGIFQRAVENLAGNLMNTMRGTTGGWSYSSAKSRRGSNYNYVDFISSAITLDNYPWRDIYIGAYQIPCLDCGKMRDDDYSSRLTCDRCYDTGYTCYCCGDVCDDEYYFDGNYYCESCFDAEVYTCDCCGERCYSSEMEYIHEQYYCPQCRDENFSYCSHCDDYVHNDDAIISSSGDPYCQRCADDVLYYCESCGEYYESVEEVNGVYYCEDCADSKFTKCYECGYYFSETTTVNGEEYCDSCLADNFTECYECGEYSDKTILVDGHEYCQKCVDELYTLCDCGNYREKDALTCPSCGMCIEEKEEVLV
jgi:hypothetical protein